MPRLFSELWWVWKTRKENPLFSYASVWRRPVSLIFFLLLYGLLFFAPYLGYAFIAFVVNNGPGGGASVIALFAIMGIALILHLFALIGLYPRYLSRDQLEDIRQTQLRRSELIVPLMLPTFLALLILYITMLFFMTGLVAGVIYMEEIGRMTGWPGAMSYGITDFFKALSSMIEAIARFSEDQYGRSSRVFVVLSMVTAIEFIFLVFAFSFLNRLYAFKSLWLTMFLIPAIEALVVSFVIYVALDSRIFRFLPYDSEPIVAAVLAGVAACFGFLRFRMHFASRFLRNVEPGWLHQIDYSARELAAKKLPKHLKPQPTAIVELLRPYRLLLILVGLIASMGVTLYYVSTISNWIAAPRAVATTSLILVIFHVAFMLSIRRKNQLNSFPLVSGFLQGSLHRYSYPYFLPILPAAIIISVFSATMVIDPRDAVGSLGERMASYLIYGLWITLHIIGCMMAILGSIFISTIFLVSWKSTKILWPIFVLFVFAVIYQMIFGSEPDPIQLYPWQLTWLMGMLLLGAIGMFQLHRINRLELVNVRVGRTNLDPPEPMLGEVVPDGWS